MGQKQQLIWDLPPAETFLVNRAIYDIPDDVYRQRVGELTELLDLGGLLNKPTRQLSLGERMKCELAAALLHRPQVLFLDEPTIGLDVTMQQAVRDFIAGYNERHGATVLLTSHYMDDVAALCPRVIVIDSGELIYDGDLSSLVEQTAPQKLLKLEFRVPQSEAVLRGYGDAARVLGAARGAAGGARPRHRDGGAPAQRPADRRHRHRGGADRGDHRPGLPRRQAPRAEAAK